MDRIIEAAVRGGISILALYLVYGAIRLIAGLFKKD
jgi:hypothetical protein